MNSETVYTDDRPMPQQSLLSLLKRSRSARAGFRAFVVLVFFSFILANTDLTDVQSGQWPVLILFAVVLCYLLVAILRGFITGIREAREWQRVLRLGQQAEATVTLVDRKTRRIRGGMRITECWVVAYRYRDYQGSAHDAESWALSRKEAAAYRAGDKGFVCYDPNQPDKSVWIGRPEA